MGIGWRASLLDYVNFNTHREGSFHCSDDTCIVYLARRRLSYFFFGGSEGFDTPCLTDLMPFSTVPFDVLMKAVCSDSDIETILFSHPVSSLLAPCIGGDVSYPI